MVRTLSLCALFLVLIASPVVASELDDLAKKAESGDFVAQWELVKRGAGGEDVHQDDVKIFQWTRRAANNANAEAQFFLGNLYIHGAGVKRDVKQAEKWFRLAAENGDARAQNNLGLMFSNVGRSDADAHVFSDGATENCKEAVKWMRLAAQQGMSVAQENLGAFYLVGCGVSKDYDQAAIWFRRASEQGQMFAQMNLGDLYRDGHGVTQDFQEALYWYGLAATQGNKKATRRITCLSFDGHGPQTDEEMFQVIVENAKKEYLIKEQRAFGDLYLFGQECVSVDKGKAAKWYRRAAENGDMEAQFTVGRLYANGEGVKQDSGEALTWYRRAAKQGSLTAKSAIDRLHEAGKEVEDLMAAKKPLMSGSGDRFPTRPATVPGRVSCNTRCVNAECWRTYNDGQQVHFHAPRKFDPLSGEWQFDAGGC
ncbi:MAG: hypothetical protein JWM78_1874 [Verrucomicrobiaceae bacterium]|nr:hypothetical protein [Verrucomicrobiaceae bacterium]